MFLCDPVTLALSGVSYRKARAEDFPRITLLIRNSVDDLLRAHGDNYLLMSSEPFSNFSNYVLYPTGAML